MTNNSTRTKSLIALVIICCSGCFDWGLPEDCESNNNCLATIEDGGITNDDVSNNSDPDANNTSTPDANNTPTPDSSTPDVRIDSNPDVSTPDSTDAGIGDTSAIANLCDQASGATSGPISNLPPDCPVDIIIDNRAIVNSDTLAITTGTFIDGEFPAELIEANYVGAVDPASANGWFAGWTYANLAIAGTINPPLDGQPFHPLENEIRAGIISPASVPNCGPFATEGGSATLFGIDFPVCILQQSDPILASKTLTKDHIWLLNGIVRVGNGHLSVNNAPFADIALTIEAGTSIFGINDTFSKFLITRGSRINAIGTPGQPIVLAAAASDGTSITDSNLEDISGRGLWGGITITGFGRTTLVPSNNPNPSATEILSEASPSNFPWFFGGTNNDDNSGTLQYIVIAEAGRGFEVDRQHQALNLEAVGAQTTIDHIQVINSSDDCIEYIGGAVNSSHLVCNAPRDDGLDTDDGYQGNIQFAIVTIGYGDLGNHGLEADGSGTRTPPTTNQFANITVFGDYGNQDSSSVDLRDRWQGNIYRSAFIDGFAARSIVTRTSTPSFSKGCFEISRVSEGFQVVDSMILSVSCSPQIRINN